MHDHALDLVLPQPALEALAECVAEIIGTSTEGYLGANAAADFLGISRRALYALVEPPSTGTYEEGKQAGLQAAMRLLLTLDPDADPGPLDPDASYGPE